MEAEAEDEGNAETRTGQWAKQRKVMMPLPSLLVLNLILMKQEVL